MFGSASIQEYLQYSLAGPALKPLAGPQGIRTETMDEGEANHNDAPSLMAMRSEKEPCSHKGLALEA